MANEWITRSKLITDLIFGKMHPKMSNYYLRQIFRFGKKNPNGDDFYWKEYTSHYQGELEGVKNKISLTIQPGDYLFEDNKLKKINSNILSISPHAHLLTESICLLRPNSIREVGVGGGDYLNNIFVMLPNIDLEGVDISTDQLTFLAKKHPHLKNFTFEFDIVSSNDGLSKTQLSYTQAVIMHIGEKNDRHLSALKNLINSTTETVLLSENWHKHNFLEDIKFLFDKGMINWSNINYYIKPYLENPEIKLMICSNKKLPFEELKNYQQLKN